MILSAEDLRLTIETCCAVVYYRNDLTRIFVAAGVPSAILESLPPPFNPEWGHTKREVADHVVMSLAAMSDGAGLGPLRRIVAQVADWHNFATAKEPERARALVRQLNAEVNIQREQQRHEAKERELAQSRTSLLEPPDKLDYFRSVGGLRDSFLALRDWPNAQQRGYRFQDLLYELFNLADLRPGKPFRVRGEEIDGTLVLDFQNYLLEARWQADLVGQADLLAFSGKVERRIECTRGLFLAVNGFSMDGIAAFQRKRPSIVLMDGAHLMVALEGHVHLRDLLRALFEAASKTGQVYTPTARLRLS